MLCADLGNVIMYIHTSTIIHANVVTSNAGFLLPFGPGPLLLDRLTLGNGPTLKSLPSAPVPATILVTHLGYSAYEVYIER